MEPKDFKQCAFCGAKEELFEAYNVVQIITSNSFCKMCVHCKRSMEHRMPRNWFNWLKRNDPQRWEQIVSHHQGGKSYISYLVTQVREEALPNAPNNPML